MSRKTIRSVCLAACLLLLLPAVSCKKEIPATVIPSSIRIISTANEPKRVNMVSSAGGMQLVYITSGDLIEPPVRQELFLLRPTGESAGQVHLSDTLFEYIRAVPGIDGGFFICATSDLFSQMAIFHVNDQGAVLWSKSIVVKSGTSLREPDIRISRDQHYLVMYQSYGSGYYLWKGDAGGTEVFNKKFPTPNAIHYGSGLNYGEKYVNLFQPNDTLFIVQGITYDQYEERVENCFVRAVSENLAKLWYSDNYDSSRIESGAGLAYEADRIVLFGASADNLAYEHFGDVFARRYTTSGIFEGDLAYPRAGGTPTTVNRVVTAPGGGYLLAGSNGQLPQHDLVSPNQPVLMKLNPDLSTAWTRVVQTGFPARGHDVVYHSDGTIGLIGLMKDNYATNKVLYIHLTALGEVINN